MLPKRRGGIVGEAIASRAAAPVGEPAADPCSRSGSPNRGPPKAIGAPLTNSITVLSSGIDSLYVSFRGAPNPSVLETLRPLQTEARESGQPQVLRLAGATKALVQPSGWGRYRYWLRCDGFDAFLGSGSGLPSVYVRLLSSFIHEVGPTSALAEVNLFVNGPLLAEMDEVRCSRVDIYADFQGWVPRSDDHQHFVGRSRKNTWHTAVHHDGRSFTGFTFGRDAMVARLYDKSLEITRSGKDWMREVWGDRLDPSQPVWRLEFQLRRQVLKECLLDDAEQVIGRRQHLWAYATRWLSLREPSPMTRRARWPVAYVWAQLARAKVETSQSPLVRERIRKHDESVLVRGLAGYASSLAAIAGVSDLDVTMVVSRRRLAEHMNATGRDFRDLVHAKRDRSLSR